MLGDGHLPTRGAVFFVHQRKNEPMTETETAEVETFEFSSEETSQPIKIDGAGKDSVVMIPLELFKQLKSETLCCWPQKLPDT